MKKLIPVFALMSLIGVFLGYLMTNSTGFGICLHDQYSCRDVLNRFGDPILYASVGLFIVFAILYFVPRAVSAWSKFAIWYIPLAAIIFATARESTGWISLFPSLIPLYQTTMGIYVLVSLLIISLVSFSSKKN